MVAWRAKSDDRAGESGAAVALKRWDPNTPYLAALRAAKKGMAHEVYLKQRESYAASPAFYLDCAEFFLQQNQKEAAIRILTDIAELELESAPLLRIVAHRLSQIG